jgi:hypothetical protein
MDSGDDFFDQWFNDNVDIAAIKTELFEFWVAGRNAERQACIKIAENCLIEDKNILEGSEVAKAQHETALLIAKEIKSRGETS